MSSSNKTPNIGLNSWLPEDRPKMDDFNSDNGIIDTKIDKNTKDIAQLNSDFTALNGNMTTINDAFQKTANLKTAKFGYDSKNSFWIDYIITSTSICRIIFNASNIIQAFSSDGGATWTTIWTK